MNTLCTAAQQALEALEYEADRSNDDAYRKERDALRAALAEPVQEPDLSRCPQCGGPADNGHDRSIPPTPYWCTKCMAEPVPDSKHATIAEWWADKQRKPMTKDEIELAYRHIYRNLPYEFDHSIGSWVEQGIKYAERVHGIGGTDE